jgi:hypothetical protein
MLNICLSHFDDEGIHYLVNALKYRAETLTINQGRCDVVQSAVCLSFPMFSNVDEIEFHLPWGHSGNSESLAVRFKDKHRKRRSYHLSVLFDAKRHSKTIIQLGKLFCYQPVQDELEEGRIFDGEEANGNKMSHLLERVVQ